VHERVAAEDLGPFGSDFGDDFGRPFGRVFCLVIGVLRLCVHRQGGDAKWGEYQKRS
jgi:hypothetical protein